MINKDRSCQTHEDVSLVKSFFYLICLSTDCGECGMLVVQGASYHDLHLANEALLDLSRQVGT